MRAIGRVQLTTTELPDALEFEATREYGWLEMAIWLAISLGCIWMFWRVNTPITHLFALAIGGSLVAVALQGRKTKLRITSDEISATGNINKMFSTKTRFQISEVKWLRYEAGDGEQTSGLYVKHGWSRTCLLPELDEDQGIAVVGAIFAKFPEIAPGDKRGGSPLFGSESGLTGLGLLDRPSEKKKTEE